MSFVPTQFSSLTSNFDRLREDTNSSLNVGLSSLKSPRDFFDYQRIAIPKSSVELHDRFFFNVDYFQTNYIALMGIIFMTHFIFNLHELFLMIALIVVLYVFYKSADVESVSEINIQFLSNYFNKKKPLAIFFIITLIPLTYWDSMVLFNLFWDYKIILLVLIAHACLLDKPVNSLNDAGYETV